MNPPAALRPSDTAPGTAPDTGLPRLAVLIPVYRHSVLLVEAIEAVLAQRAPFALRLILVDDGCPFPETEAVCRDYALAHPGQVTWLRKPNGGLSDARNCGIRHVLQTLPSVEAVYMLDADNRLYPDAMARAMAALEADPAVDWIYPNIDMFGLAWSGDYGGPYSQLIHGAMNICEAGSLIRRRVFEAGVMFDTGFRMGWEDWDFFLTAAERGFTGKNLEDFGFLYRKRPESMLAESERNRALLTGAMQDKHRDLSRPAAQLALEAREAPRHAVYLPDLGEVWLITDPALPATQRLTLEAFGRLVWQAQTAPGRYRLPPFLMTMDSRLLAGLGRAGFAHWVFWALECALQEGGIATLGLAAAPAGRLALDWHKPRSTGRQHQGARIVAIGPGLLREVLADPAGDWIGRLAGAANLPPVSVLMLRGTGLESRFDATALAAFLDLIGQLRGLDWRAAGLADWDFRLQAIPYRGQEYQIVRRTVAGGPVWPRLPDGRRHVAFLLPIVEFGGVEKVALNMARALRAQGFVPHAVVLEARDIAYDAEWQAAFESTGFLMDPHFSPWHGKTQDYMGTPVPEWAAKAGHGTVLGMLHWCHAVVNFHGGAIAGAMAELRRIGVRTANSLHLNDQTVFGRDVGNTTLALAYEHAFDLFLPCSESLGDWLHGMGVPRDKIVPVPNAPAFTPPAASLPRAPRAPGPLRVLFLGRLDRQKGLDRLTAVMRGAAERGLVLDWRVIGKALMREAAPPLDDALRAVVEDPVQEPEALAALYGWADVLLLLSGFEGLPLTVLEAMRAGVAVIATDVGALREAVTDGQDGLLVPLEGAVPATLAALERLAGDPAALAAISAAAARAHAGHDWLTATRALAARLSD